MESKFLHINDIIEILVKYGVDDIRALTAVKEVIERMGYEIKHGEVIENKRK